MDTVSHWKDGIYFNKTDLFFCNSESKIFDYKDLVHVLQNSLFENLTKIVATFILPRLMTSVPYPSFDEVINRCTYEENSLYYRDYSSHVFNNGEYANPLEELETPIFKILHDQGFTLREDQLKFLATVFGPIVFPNPTKRNIIGIIGVTGSGKSTIANTLFELFLRPREITTLPSTVDFKEISSSNEIFIGLDLKRWNITNRLPEHLRYLLVCGNDLFEFDKIQCDEKIKYVFPRFVSRRQYMFRNIEKSYIEKSFGSLYRLVSLAAKKYYIL